MYTVSFIDENIVITITKENKDLCKITIGTKDAYIKIFRALSKSNQNTEDAYNEMYEKTYKKIAACEIQKISDDITITKIIEVLHKDKDDIYELCHQTGFFELLHDK